MLRRRIAGPPRRDANDAEKESRKSAERMKFFTGENRIAHESAVLRTSQSRRTCCVRRRSQLRSV